MDSEQDRYQEYEGKISKVNELRNEFWKEFRELRDDFLRHLQQNSQIRSDPHWQNPYLMLAEMWESGFKEEPRRKAKILP
jgi:hypothetical protein